jgi:hypothetical protein
VGWITRIGYPQIRQITQVTHIPQILIPLGVRPVLRHERQTTSSAAAALASALENATGISLRWSGGSCQSRLQNCASASRHARHRYRSLTRIRVVPTSRDRSRHVTSRSNRRFRDAHYFRNRRSTARTEAPPDGGRQTRKRPGQPGVAAGPDNPETGSAEAVRAALPSWPRLSAHRAPRCKSRFPAAGGSKKARVEMASRHSSYLVARLGPHDSAWPAGLVPGQRAFWRTPRKARWRVIFRLKRDRQQTAGITHAVQNKIRPRCHHNEISTRSTGKY